MKEGALVEYGLSYNNVERLEDQSLSVVQCGIHTHKSGYFSGLRVSDNYSLTFVIKGKGSYCINEVRYDIKSGEGFVIPPSVPVSYSANEADPWQYIYAIIDGVGAKSLIDRIGLSEHNVKFTFPIDSVEPKLFKMHEASRSYAGGGYDVLGYFLLCISKIVKAAEQRREVSSVNRQLGFALDYIARNYSKNITVNDIAQYVNFDRTYLYKLFKKHLNTSPVKYLTEYRLKNSILLMKYKSLSLGEIALSVGFYDASHYNHAFREKYGMSPGEYRKSIISDAEKTEESKETEAKK